MLHRRRLRLSAGRFFFPALLAILLAVHPGREARGQAAGGKDFAPGFGIVYGQGETEDGGQLTRFGFTSRRMKEGKHVGSAALVAEEHSGVPNELLDAGLAPEDVSLRYQALFVEIKRYFPIGGGFHYYWGVRGGFSRVSGTVTDPASETQESFESDLVAPLGLLALPLALENPGFLVLAFLDGASFGLTLEIVPKRIWLDFQVGSAFLPAYRDARVVVEQPLVLSSVLQVAVVF